MRVSFKGLKMESMKASLFPGSVRKLSGGNVQKVLVGREISSEPKVLMAAYPVRGLDINSSYLIYNLLNKEKQEGSAVIFVGEDLDVLLALCDRILVMCQGQVTGIVELPFYYIDYTLAQVCAFQFFNKDRRSHDNAWKKYIKLCKLGGKFTFCELVKKVGLEVPFDEGVLAKTVKPLEKVLRDYHPENF